MGYRHDQRDMACTFAAHFLLCNFHTATVADDAFVTDAFVLSAVALIVLYRTKNALAEQTVAFRFVSSIVDRLRLEHLAV
ncbi:putative uncharacterized protein [Prevotella sp. CAG:279]|nr:putative uncharacterized protein [Prevotella sp. CAG:279]